MLHWSARVAVNNHNRLRYAGAEAHTRAAFMQLHQSVFGAPAPVVMNDFEENVHGFLPIVDSFNAFSGDTSERYGYVPVEDPTSSSGGYRFVKDISASERAFLKPPVKPAAATKDARVKARNKRSERRAQRTGR